jgi:hypothetical protein
MERIAMKFGTTARILNRGYLKVSDHIYICLICSREFRYLNQTQRHIAGHAAGTMERA